MTKWLSDILQSVNKSFIMTTRGDDTGSTCLVIYERRSRSVPTKKIPRPLAFSSISHPYNDLGDATNEGHYSTDDSVPSLKSYRRRSVDIVHDLVLDRFKSGSDMSFIGQGHAVPYGSNPDSNHLLRDSQGQPPMCVKMSSLGRKVVSFHQDVPNCDTEQATRNECPPSYEILSTTQNSHEADRPSPSDMNSHGTVPRENHRSRQRSVRQQKLPGIAYLMEGEHCPGSYSLGGGATGTTGTPLASSLLPPFPTDEEHGDDDDDPNAALSTPARHKNRDDRSVVGSSRRNLIQSPADSRPHDRDQVAIASTRQSTMDKTTGSKDALKFAKQTVEVMDLGGSLPDLQIIEDFEKDSSLFAPTKSQTLNRTKREINADARKRWRLAFERIQLTVADGTVDKISSENVNENEIASVVDVLTTSSDKGCISDSGELSDEAKAKLANVKWKQVLRRLDDEKSFFRVKKGEASKHWREKSQQVGDRLREKSIAWKEKTLKAEHKLSDRANEMFKEHHSTLQESDNAVQRKPDDFKGGLMERSKTLKVHGKKAKEAIKQRSVSASRAFVERSKEFSHTLMKQPSEETGTKARRTISPFRFRSPQSNHDRDGNERETSPGNTLSKRERGRSRKKPAGAH